MRHQLAKFHTDIDSAIYIYFIFSNGLGLFSKIHEIIVLGELVLERGARERQREIWRSLLMRGNLL